MRTILCILLLGVLALVAVAETNVTGRWTGPFKIAGPEPETGTAVLVLKQTGSDITGTVGPADGDQHTITKGKIERTRSRCWWKTMATPSSSISLWRAIVSPEPWISRMMAKARKGVLT